MWGVIREKMLNFLFFLLLYRYFPGEWLTSLNSIVVFLFLVRHVSLPDSVGLAQAQNCQVDLTHANFSISFCQSASVLDLTMNQPRMVEMIPPMPLYLPKVPSHYS